MFKQVYDVARQLLLVIEDVQKLKAEQKELRQELDRLVDAVTELKYEVRQDRADHAHESEKLILRLENTLLKFERRLPPAPSGTQLPDEELP